LFNIINTLFVWKSHEIRITYHYGLVELIIESVETRPKYNLHVILVSNLVLYKKSLYWVINGVVIFDIVVDVAVIVVVLEEVILVTRTLNFDIRPFCL